MSADIEDYTGLITSEHNQRPNFMAAVEALTQFAVDERNVLAAMPDDFDLELAVGAQLDAVGLWANVTRVITVMPSETYPVPAEPYQVSLDDDTFRRLIEARILANAWDGTPEAARAVLAAFFGPAGSFAAIYDNQDMSIDLWLAGTKPTAAEAAVFSQMILPLRPSGVRINDTHIGPEGGPIFGLDFENEFINGPDFGSFEEKF